MPEPLHQCDAFRAQDRVLLPDERWTPIVNLDLATGKTSPRALETEHSRIAELTLDDCVARDVRVHFETARNLLLYSWFVYRFVQVAELHALGTLEMALRLRLDYTGDHSPGLARMLKEAFKKGLFRDEGFRHVERMKKTKPVPYPEDSVHLGGVVLPPSPVSGYAKMLCWSLPMHRNDLAHGSVTLNPWSSYLTLETCCDLINDVFRTEDQPAEETDMLDVDRVFLNDFINLTFKNRMMAVEALLRAGVDSKAFGAHFLRRANPALSEEEAREEESATNEGGRFQKVMFAKILAEFAGSLEDFGALCFAIRERATSGILQQYLESRGQVGQFFTHVLAHPGEDLGVILQLPSLATLREHLGDSDFAILTGHYEQGADLVRRVASNYRAPGGITGARGLTPLREDWQECVHILLSVGGNGPPGPHGIIPRTYNKIKHRFAVLEGVPEYAELPITEEFDVVVIEKTGERAMTLVEATRTVSMAAVEIAATLVFLLDKGVHI
jgi:hypothetical protein